MTAIWKYELLIEDHVEIMMPAGAEILCVQVQHGTPMLWAKVDQSAPSEARRFFVKGTGHSFTALQNRFPHRYVGTFQYGVDLVFHVFESRPAGAR